MSSEQGLQRRVTHIGDRVNTQGGNVDESGGGATHRKPGNLIGEQPAGVSACEVLIQGAQKSMTLLSLWPTFSESQWRKGWRDWMSGSSVSVRCDQGQSPQSALSSVSSSSI